MDNPLGTQHAVRRQQNKTTQHRKLEILASPTLAKTWGSRMGTALGTQHTVQRQSKQKYTTQYRKLKRWKTLTLAKTRGSRMGNQLGTHHTVVRQSTQKYTTQTKRWATLTLFNNWRWPHMLTNGNQLLPFMRHPPCRVRHQYMKLSKQHK